MKSYLFDTVKKDSKIKEYPQTEIDTIYGSYKNMVEQNLKSSYGVDFATYLTSNNMTEESFKENLVKNQIKPAMDEQMVA